MVHSTSILGSPPSEVVQGDGDMMFGPADGTSLGSWRMSLRAWSSAGRFLVGGGGGFVVRIRLVRRGGDVSSSPVVLADDGRMSPGSDQFFYVRWSSTTDKLCSSAEKGYGPKQ
mmetsp:Transcript_2965/g.5275  ORF Transcript_2965/g.5275 Transcript_2965/m.5275 type:complete len:114 (-) Transcript_2965:48-389(-)|eukprot:CAMPEP_0197453688 /NCGR_PEP_ID=MMETSP1175-20131217/35724_1 /TAXON_ID=1003142 /ORGANISM="Triceratium dubium, Strain CCMP147" /LENGTH=113 /DNA_ID=CAMNT_0042987059 /DNA_START=530 /DNA_END=871 /DNA_ORIENTATION=+